LPIYENPCYRIGTGMSDTAPYAADWESKVAFMRARCLTSAKWTTVLDPIGCKSHEVLSEAVCGPLVAPLTIEEQERETQPSISPQEQERRERIKRREVVGLSSGGPVRRLDVER
jgi:hypothetical protein